jgi:hypothetical protein
MYLNLSFSAILSLSLIGKSLLLYHYNFITDKHFQFFLRSSTNSLDVLSLSRCSLTVLSLSRHSLSLCMFASRLLKVSLILSFLSISKYWLPAALYSS